MEEPQIHEIESIRGLQYINGKLYFHVHWYGYTDDEDTFEPIENLDNCAELVKNFLFLNNFCVSEDWNVDEAFSDMVEAPKKYKEVSIYDISDGSVDTSELEDEAVHDVIRHFSFLLDQNEEIPPLMEPGTVRFRLRTENNLRCLSFGDSLALTNAKGKKKAKKAHKVRIRGYRFFNDVPELEVTTDSSKTYVWVRLESLLRDWEQTVIDYLLSEWEKL